VFRIFSKKEYRISVNSEDWVAPEETLLDSGSEFSDLEVPIAAGVFRVTEFLTLACLLLILFFAFKMSVWNNERYFNLAVRNRTVNFAVSPPRGVILDRNGKALVKNIPTFNLLVVGRELLADKEQRSLTNQKVAEVLELPKEEFEASIKASLKKSGIFFVASDMTKEQVLEIKNIDPTGFHIVTGTKRSYIDGPQFAEILGYTGQVNPNDLSKDLYYLPTDTIGRIGIESSYESTLRGQHGQIVFSKKGEESVDQDPIPGDNVVLNIDSEIQKKLFNELFKVLRGANLSSAAAVIQNPQNGAVLGMVSFPDFDNNIFSGKISEAEAKRLFESKSKPLFNRVIGGLYNPGSTIKPFMGLIGLQEKIITPQTTVPDCVSISIPNPANPDQPYVFKNWRPEMGAFNLRRAIANSCNVFFYIMGGGFQHTVGVGAEKIVKYLNTALANIKLGIDLPGEDNGFVPSPTWKQKTRGENWYQGDTYNISIGQGDLLVTPLWLNSYLSAIANGGVMYKPQVAQRIIDKNRQDVKVFQPQKLLDLPFSKENIEAVRSDMTETVNSGTAKALRDLPVQAAAKTGTAEVIKGHEINSLFTVFAPYDHPEVAMTILVEGSASNEGYAINAAHNFLKWYFEQYRPGASPVATPTGL
jgi:penicillin-binding protein 2